MAETITLSAEQRRVLTSMLQGGRLCGNIGSLWSLYSPYDQYGRRFYSHPDGSSVRGLVRRGLIETPKGQGWTVSAAGLAAWNAATRGTAAAGGADG